MMPLSDSSGKKEEATLFRLNPAIEELTNG
jgi:hypothetical protein